MHRKRPECQSSGQTGWGFGACPAARKDGRTPVVMLKSKIVHCDLAPESICRSNRLVMDSLVLNSLKRAGHESEHTPRGSA